MKATDPRYKAFLLEKLAERKQAAEQPVDLLSTSFPEQTAFIKDPSKFKVAFCTRRAGKSYGVGLYLIQEALHNPRCSVLYLALTMKTAKRTMVKDILQPIFSANNISPTYNKTESSFTLTNGSIIYLAGADAKEDEMEKVLGQKYALVIIDECASFSQDLNRLVNKLIPGVSDYDGTIALIGTPSNYTDNYFYELTKPDAEPSIYSVHRWTWQDNPHNLETRKKAHDRLITARPLYPTTNEYKQEWLGQWAIDESALCYQYSQANLIQPFILKNYYFVLGVDLGWEDDTAFCVMAYSYNDPCAYIITTYKQKHMDFFAVEKKTKELANQYPFVKYVIDGGGGAKQGVETMKVHQNIPWQSTPKSPDYKFTAIKLMTSELRTQTVKIFPGNEALLKEYDRMVWDEKAPTKEKASKDNHLADATLYAFIACKHYRGTTPTLIEPLKPEDEPQRNYRPIIIEEDQPLGWLDTNYGDL